LKDGYVVDGQSYQMVGCPAMQTTLRTATSSDAERIADIYLLSRKLYLPYAPLAHTDEDIRAWISTRLIPTENVYVGVVAGNIHGFVAISKDSHGGWIDHIYLDPSKVGKGLGALLVEHAKQALGNPIRLYTFQANSGARRFYQRHGFREIEFSDGASNEEKTPDVLLEWP
jgi:GNAT superfamily N-acetyltransferase